MPVTPLAAVAARENRSDWSITAASVIGRVSVTLFYISVIPVNVQIKVMMYRRFFLMARSAAVLVILQIRDLAGTADDELIDEDFFTQR
jgi:hypothetical protein